MKSVTYTGPQDSSDLSNEFQVEDGDGERVLLRVNDPKVVSNEMAQVIQDAAEASAQNVKVKAASKEETAAAKEEAAAAEAEAAASDAEAEAVGPPVEPTDEDESA